MPVLLDVALSLLFSLLLHAKSTGNDDNHLSRKNTAPGYIRIV
jgi:hypothetical protein